MNMNRRDMIKGAFGATAVTLVSAEAIAIPEEEISPEEEKRDALLYLVDLPEEERHQIHMLLLFLPEGGSVPIVRQRALELFDDGCTVGEVYEYFWG